MTTSLSPDIDDQLFNENRTIPRQRFNYSANLNAETGEWVIIPAGIGNLLVSVDPAAGSARIEYTQSDLAAVKAGTAVAKPWAAADVSTYTDKIMVNAITAVRAVCTAACTMRVTA
ncbi:MAG: hypothetical protein R3180_00180 [Marinobacter sp.]|nr:hypothetical protein [Marinobacter sp.]